MEVIIYQKNYNRNESIERFFDLLYSNEMNHFASDLLHEGLSIDDIQNAINRAVLVGISSGLNIRKHFAPMYTKVNQQIFRDCKLTKVGYALVLINARPDSKVTGKWQMTVISNMLKHEY